MTKRPSDKSLTREQFLRGIIAKRGQRTAAQTDNDPTPVEQAQWERVIQSIKRLRNNRAALAGDGDDTPERVYLELHELTGVDVVTLQSMSAGDVDKLIAAGTRKRMSQRSGGDPWVVVSVADCEADRSTLKRHADDPAKPWIEKTGRGKYRIRDSRLVEYVQASELEKYRR